MMKRVFLILIIIFGLMLFGGGIASTMGVLSGLVPIIGLVGLFFTSIAWFIITRFLMFKNLHRTLKGNKESVE
jgi:hypothetical protein